MPLKAARLECGYSLATQKLPDVNHICGPAMVMSVTYAAKVAFPLPVGSKSSVHIITTLMRLSTTLFHEPTNPQKME